MIYQGLFGMEAGVLTRLPRADSNATRESAIAWSDACPRLIAAATRVLAIEEMEKAKGIERDHKQLHGKKTFIVYMSKEDKKSKDLQNARGDRRGPSRGDRLPKEVRAQANRSLRASC